MCAIHIIAANHFYIGLIEVHQIMFAWSGCHLASYTEENICYKIWASVKTNRKKSRNFRIRFGT